VILELHEQELRDLLNCAQKSIQRPAKRIGTVKVLLHLMELPVGFVQAIKRAMRDRYE